MWKDNGLQLVMLPTDNESKLSLDSRGRLYLGNYPKYTPDNQYLYLLSDEEIKEGDKYYDSHNNLILTASENSDHNTYSYKKVIASTDLSLNLPQFSSPFLEEYVKRYNSKKSLEVEVTQHIRTEKICQNCIDYESSYHCEICNSNLDMFNRLPNTISIRFKEEKPCTHEVVSEAMRLVSKDVRSPKVKYTLDGERMYSKSEVEELCRNAFKAGEAYRTSTHLLFKESSINENTWLKENLK